MVDILDLSAPWHAQSNTKTIISSRSAFGKRIKSEALGGSKAKALTESGTLELSMLSLTWLQLFKASENANGSVLSIQKRL